MYSLEDVTVIVPTLNEEEAIGKVLDEILSLGIDPGRIIVVDGHSTDNTREIASSKGVRVILQEGKGKADAIKTAIKYVETPVTVLMDGDYTYPARHIPDIVETLRRGYDMVIGVRRQSKESQPLVYKIGNKLLSKTFQVLFGVNLRDVLSGMYAVKTDLLRELSFESKGFGIESEIVAHVATTGGRIAEVEIEYRPRLGEKKLGVRHGFHILWDMIRLAWHYNPVFFIFSVGSLLLIPGLLLVGYVGYHYLVHGVKYHVKGLIGISLLLTGVLSLHLSILSVYLKRMEIRLMKRLRELKG